MKPIQSRRSFLFTLTGATVGLGALAHSALGADQAPLLPESDPTAQALGYKTDTTKVDGQKYPQHKPEQICADCALYVGKAGEADGPCNAFGGKRVTAKGWCMAYAKKP